MHLYHLLYSLHRGIHWHYPTSDALISIHTSPWRSALLAILQLSLPTCGYIGIWDFLLTTILPMYRSPLGGRIHINMCVLYSCRETSHATTQWGVARPQPRYSLPHKTKPTQLQLWCQQSVTGYTDIVCTTLQVGTGRWCSTCQEWCV